MASIVEEAKIGQERYVEIKKMAYTYYEQFISLDRASRKEFLDNLPSIGTAFENDILINTLLFPDTEQLLTIPKGHLYSVLGKIANNEDYITDHNINAKIVEYSTQNISELIQDGKLQVMDGVRYTDSSISDKQYKSLKDSAVNFVETFHSLPLNEKVELICGGCAHSSYQEQIQIATLLIPNDKELIEQLKNASTSDIANYYMVPESLINFKVEEHKKQNTEELIKEGQLNTVKSNRIWYSDSLNDGMPYMLWDQGFYQKVEENLINKSSAAIEGMFKEYSKQSIK